MRKLYILILIVCLSSCVDREEKKLHTISIGFELSDNIDDITLDGQEVRIRNLYSNRTYVSKFVDGSCKMELETGVYSINTSCFSKKRGNLSATIDNIEICENSDNSIVLQLNYTYSSPIIIKQVYYSGAKTPLNKNYLYDQFVELYNNSDEPQSLKGLCLAAVLGTSFSPSKWVDEEGRLLSYLPIHQTVWRFPDSNEKLILDPGESIIVAQDAINHSDPERSNSKVDLTDADFETYKDDSGRDDDNFDVDNMKLIWSKSTRTPDWILVSFGSPVILFRLPEDYKSYVENVDNIKPQPGSSVKYLCIPKTFVLDAVECVHSEKKNNKRLHNELDAGYVYVSKHFSGYSVIRKIQSMEGSRAVYMDTNNSSLDFLTDQQPDLSKYMSNSNSEQ